jgi:hypothetical protein
VTSFLQQIISLGDGFRRYICIGICSNSSLTKLIKTIPDLNYSSNSILFDFFGKLINDSYFKEQFSISIFQETGNLFLYYKNILSNQQCTSHLKPFSLFVFHIFSPDVFEQFLKYNFDFPLFFATIYVQTNELFLLHGDNNI